MRQGSHFPAWCRCGLGIALTLYTAAGNTASDGTVGNTSSGTLQISITIEPTLAFVGLKDLQLEPLAAQPHWFVAPACIQSRFLGAYELRAAGSGAGQAFALSNGAQVLPYDLYFDQGSGPQAITPNQILPGHTATRSASANCNAMDHNGRLLFNLPNIEPLATEKEPFSGTLTLLIAPD